MRILYNGKIHTQYPPSPLVSALAFDHGWIKAIGDNQQILDAFPNPEQSRDLDGATVIPGLVDAHIHLHKFALGQQKINCEVSSKTKCLQRVAEQARRASPGSWILGHGWNQNDWDGGFGTAVDLDKVAPNNPVFLTAKSLHAAWVNELALKLTGVSTDTPNPANGEILRGRLSKPNGILLEGAMELVSSRIPEPTFEETISAILNAQDILLGMGITGIHDFDREVSFSALQTIQARGNLKLRVVKSLPFEALQDAIDLGLRSGFGNEKLRIGGIKIFVDGALGPHTAAMTKPYENEQDNLGMLFMDKEELFLKGGLAVRNGLSLAIHAIGDRANNKALGALSKLRDLEQTLDIQPQLRHRIEHVQLLLPEDIPRLGNLKISASMQPIHAVSDMVMADRYWGSRSALAYAWKSLQKHGTVLAFGSDAPVESPNPFWGIHAAVTRQQENGFPGPNGWYPEQRLSIEEAIRAYSIGPAYTSGTEKVQGRLSPGYHADLLVLDRDIFQCERKEIREIKPIATMIGGEWLSDDI